MNNMQISTKILKPSKEASKEEIVAICTDFEYASTGHKTSH